MKRFVGGLLLTVAMAAPLSGQSPPGVGSRPLPLPLATRVAAPLSGQLLTLPIPLPGISAELTTTFESVTNLSLLNLGLSVRLVSPFDPALRSRLPAGTSIPLPFPVLIRIEPPPAGGLAFHGVASIGLHIENLLYFPGCPLRLFAAPLGGPFEDITADMGAGSYRVRGTRGGFSEFLVVRDVRPLDQVAATKLDRLEEMFVEYAAAIPAPLRASLADQLAAVHEDLDGGDLQGAVEDLDAFTATVVAHSGTDIPDLWRSTRDVENVAGYLRAAAYTLRFSLEEELGS